MSTRMSKEPILDSFAGHWQDFYAPLLQGELSNGKCNGELVALCPLHGDSEPSLNINIQDGRWYCHAEKCGGDCFTFWARLKGHDIKADFSKILQEIGSHYSIEASSSSKKSIKPRIVKTYPYYDENVNLLFEVCRLEPKSFRQRRTDKGVGPGNLTVYGAFFTVSLRS